MPKGEQKGSRTRKLTRGQKRQQSKQETKKAAQKRAKIPGGFCLTWQAIKILRIHWKPLGGIALVYAVINMIFASGISGINASIDSIRAGLEGDRLRGAFDGLGTLLSSTGAGGSQAAPILQSILIILTSLVLIWALRQLLAGNLIGIKQAYYQSMTPLIPFLLVLLVVFIQLLPVTLGASFVATVFSTIFSSGGGFTALFLVFFAALAAWSFYMMSSSIFALYIVTLPDMQPRPALRSAKNLVRFRRWPLMRRLAFLPLFLLVIMAVLIIPLILFTDFLVAPVFYILGVVTLVFVHTYLYNLYRRLLE